MGRLGDREKEGGGGREQGERKHELSILTQRVSQQAASDGWRKLIFFFQMRAENTLPVYSLPYPEVTVHQCAF